jgi:SAM-dependent methyltransferase
MAAREAAPEAAPAPRPDGDSQSWSRGLDLALISFLILYFEMIVIRWLSSDVRVFAYFKNLPLLAAFLGLGIGCMRARDRSFRLFTFLLFGFCAIVAFAGPLDLVHLYIPQQNDLKFFNDPQASDFARPVALLVFKFLVVVVGLFFLVVAMFTVLGEKLGALFDSLPPTRAYTVNLVGSLLGIWVFAALAWLEWPPLGWLALGCLVLLRFVGRRALLLAPLVALLVVVALAPGATRWSPYYRVDLAPAWVPGAGGQLDPFGYVLGVNHDVFQFAFDMSEPFLAAHADQSLELWGPGYSVPYAIARPRRVLVVGAGMGNDVAAALRYGAEHVDAVEIDPTIADLGRTYHPEQPYRSPRVRVITDDARAFFAHATDQYDMIVFGVLDSHTLLSSMSSLRLDSYVYTLESLRQARALLAPGGYLALSYSEAAQGHLEWLTARFFQIVTSAFGEEPVVLTLNLDESRKGQAMIGSHADTTLTSYARSTLYVVGPDVRARVAQDPALARLVVDPAPLRVAVPLPTDDWPFIYLRDRSVPFLPYGALLAMLMLLSTALLLRVSRHDRRTLDVPMFLLGAGFMLVEVKSVTQLSLLFGSTWLVNAITISAILVLALLANLFVGRWQPTRLGPAFALLFAALILDYLVPLDALNSQDVAVRALLGSLLTVLPILFAGVIFATLFARATHPARAFGSNVLGALAGGMLEYLSMAFGFKALGVVVLALYLASWLALRQRRRPAPAEASRSDTASPPAQPSHLGLPTR